MDVGCRLMEGRDAFRQQRGPGDLRGAQTDGAVLGRAQLPQLLLGVLHELENLPPPGLEEAALLRQLKLPAPSDQQGDPQLLLQALDLPGEGGLGHVELFRCPGDVPLLGHSEEVM